MKLWQIYQSDVPAIVVLRKGIDVVSTAMVYAAILLALAFIGVGFGHGLAIAAQLGGAEPGTVENIRAFGTIALVVLLVVGGVLTIGDAIKMLKAYARNWGRDAGE